MLKISEFFEFCNFLANISDFCKNSDRTIIGIVRFVRSLADRTFQLRPALELVLSKDLVALESQRKAAVLKRDYATAQRLSYQISAAASIELDTCNTSKAQEAKFELANSSVVVDLPNTKKDLSLS